MHNVDNDGRTHAPADFAVAAIALAELLGTSLWFTANGVAGALEQALGFDVVAIGKLTSAVQLGFIFGTLLIALTGFADRFAASRIFFFATLLGAAANAAFAFSDMLVAMLAWRFVTGLALAGIYPLGMKLVVRWMPERAGQSLGLLVGMLVLGTSLPHLVQALAWQPAWRPVVLVASGLALAGGLLVRFIGDGPARGSSSRTKPGAVLKAFTLPAFRAAAVGYFGHMWELYALWAIAPYLLRRLLPDSSPDTISLAAFCFIACGALGCIVGGRLSERFGSARIAFAALFISGALCITGPLLLPHAMAWLALPLLFAWGVAVVADSPQFSALIARAAPPDAIGSGLAIVNGIGFAVTVASISLLAPAWQREGVSALWLLAPGPVIGLLFLWPIARRAVA